MEHHAGDRPRPSWRRMTMDFGRRPFIAAFSASLVLAAGPEGIAAEPSLAAIEGRRGGRLGVFAIDTGSGPNREPDAREAVLREVGAAIVEWIG